MCVCVCGGGRGGCGVGMKPVQKLIPKIIQKFYETQNAHCNTSLHSKPSLAYFTSFLNSKQTIDGWKLRSLH